MASVTANLFLLITVDEEMIDLLKDQTCSDSVDFLEKNSVVDNFVFYYSLTFC